MKINTQLFDVVSQLETVYHNFLEVEIIVKKLKIELINHEKQLIILQSSNLENNDDTQKNELPECQKRVRVLESLLKITIDELDSLSNLCKKQNNLVLKDVPSNEINQPDLLHCWKKIANLSTDLIPTLLLTAKTELADLISSLQENSKNINTMMKNVIEKKHTLEASISKHATDLEDKCCKMDELQHSQKDILSQLQLSNLKCKEQSLELHSIKTNNLSLLNQVDALQSSLTFKEEEIFNLKDEKQAQLLTNSQLNATISELKTAIAQTEKEFQSALSKLNAEQTLSNQLQLNLNDLKNQCDILKNNLIIGEQSSIQSADCITNLEAKIVALSVECDAAKKEAASQKIELQLATENNICLQSKFEKMSQDFELSHKSFCEEKNNLRYFIQLISMYCF